MRMKAISIVIPVYNEEKYITSVIDDVIKADSLGLEKEIIVVDDGSTDKTYANVKTQMTNVKSSSNDKKNKYVIHLIRKEKNEGKGAALKSGFEKATGDILMVQDADREYSTKDYPALIKPFMDDKAQAVYGSRNKNRKEYKTTYSYFVFYLGGILLTQFMNNVYGLRLTDQATGYKLFSKDLKKYLLTPCENGFSYEVAVTGMLAKNNIPFMEVPIHYHPRTMQEGKKINAIDFMKALYIGIKYRL